MFPTTYLKSAIVLIIRCHWHFSCQNVVCHFCRWNQIIMKRTPPVILWKKMGWVKSQWDFRFEGADQKVAVLKRPTMFVFIMFWVPWRLVIVLENSLMYISEQHTIKIILNKNKAKRGTLYWRRFQSKLSVQLLNFFSPQTHHLYEFGKSIQKLDIISR